MGGLRYNRDPGEHPSCGDSYWSASRLRVGLQQTSRHVSVLIRRDDNSRGVLVNLGWRHSFAKTRARGVVASLVGAILCSTGSAALTQEPLKLAGSQLEPVKWTELAGWSTDDHLAAFAAYQASCQGLRKGHTDDRRPVHTALLSACRKASGLMPQDSQAARTFFEENFQPVRIARLGESKGLLTGYFEPIVQGSRYPSPEFHVPLYCRPRDLVPPI
jgi:MltA specific insert domain